jgi:hypothetical protein
VQVANKGRLDNEIMLGQKQEGGGKNRVALGPKKSY